MMKKQSQERLDGTGKPVAAMSISGPVNRILGERKEGIAAALIQACGEVSKRLGFAGGHKDSRHKGKRLKI